MGKIEEMLAERKAPGLRGVCREAHKDLRDVAGTIRGQLKAMEEGGHIKTDADRKYAEKLAQDAKRYEVTHPVVDYQVVGNPYKDKDHID